MENLNDPLQEKNDKISVKDQSTDSKTDNKYVDNKSMDNKPVELYKLDRTNTNISIQLLEYIKKISPEEKYKFLKYYQNIVRDYVLKVDVGSKGLLVAHTMGMGKSMVAAAVAMDMIDAGYEIIVLTTKSLHENMRKGIRKYIKLRTEHDKYYKLGTLSDKDLDEWINRNYSFVSMNASNMLKQMSAAARSLEEKEMDKKFKSVSDLGTLDGKVLIVDEAHNLFRAITNGSKNALGLYNVIMFSKRVKLIFLTGTPIASDPFELVPCFNMLARRDGKPVLPEDWKTFHKLYVNPSTGHIINKEKFQNRIFGLLSYVNHKSIIQTGGPTVEFPEELKPVIKFVNMSRHQYVLYTLAREKEKDEGKMRAKYRGDMSNTPLLQKPRSDTSSSYRVRSRQLSNYAPPSEFSDYILGKASKRKSLIAVDENNKIENDNKIENKNDNEIDNKIENKNDNEIKVITEVSPMRSVSILDKIKSSDVYSPKLAAILESIEKHGKTLGIVYSQFTGVGGLGILQRYLENNGYKLYNGQSTSELNQQTNCWLTIESEEKRGGLGTVQLYPSVLSKRYKKEKIVETSSVTATKWKKYIKDIRKNVSKVEAIDKQSKIYTKKSYEKKKLPHVGGKAEVKDNKKDNIIDNKKLVKVSLPSKIFAVVYGEIKPDERVRIQNIFNGDDNKHGEIMSLILLSSTGAEGLDLKNVRHVHIMEPYWNYSRLDQVKHRAIRNDSHIGLPKNERNVSTYIYLSIRPDDTKELVLDKLRLLPRGQESKRVSAAITNSEISDDGEIPSVGIVSSGPVPVKDPNAVPLPVPLQQDNTDEGAVTTDIKLFRESVKNHISIESFARAYQEVSIECEYNAESRGEKGKCRVCQPNNRKLYGDDPETDVKGTDRCSPIEEKMVKAKKIKINGETYYWIENSSALYGFKVYEHDKSINGYRELSESSGIYQQMQEELKKSNMK
jgi:hypothetical protein